MSWFSNYARSSVGAKHIMAVTGLALALFVFVHMLGNFAVYAGQDAMNGYAETLKSTGAFLWLARLGLLATVVIHIAAAVRLSVLNKAARPEKYRMFKPIRSSFHARVMPWTGLIVFAFIVYHLMHFTLGTFYYDYYSAVQELPGGATRHDVYSMVVQGFQIPAVALSYVVAMVLLCFHLAHGMTSFFQSLGLNHPKYNAIIRYAGPVYAAIILIGNSSIPIAILAGAVDLPGA
ncbi:MAG: succinate dehydrogenase cytochrome b subunit [Proteobacteria bacterium]|nr:succinate dehydrogenase cytochrome b subunit [Pseudomonadota bacterium]